MPTSPPALTRPAQRTVRRDPMYDGDRPFGEAAPGARYPWLSAPALVTLLLVVGPLLGVVVAVALALPRGTGLFPLVLAALLYAVSGLGVTLGFHRGTTHGAFRAKSWLRVTLAVAGSLSFQGAVGNWVATHRQHHALTDEPGDPHSPYRFGTSPAAQLRGFVDSHAGWLWRRETASIDTYAPDVLADPGLRAVHRAFPLLCVVSLAVPFVAGLAWTHTLAGALTTFLWAGVVRVAVLQHVTWSINSLCHVAGSRPYATRRFDRAGDVWQLALLSLGESWHNGHHADPTCAVHGRGRHQLDLSAAVLRGFESVGWVSHVRWPSGAPEPRVTEVCE